MFMVSTVVSGYAYEYEYECRCDCESLNQSLNHGREEGGRHERLLSGGNCHFQLTFPLPLSTYLPSAYSTSPPHQTVTLANRSSTVLASICPFPSSCLTEKVHPLCRSNVLSGLAYLLLNQQGAVRVSLRFSISSFRPFCILHDDSLFCGTGSG